MVKSAGPALRAAMNETGDSGIEGNNFCDCPKGTLREFLWKYDHCRYAFYQAEDDLKQAEKRFKKHLSTHEDQEKLEKHKELIMMEKLLGPEGGVGRQKPLNSPNNRMMSERDLSNVLKMLSLGAAAVNVQLELSEYEVTNCGWTLKTEVTELDDDPDKFFFKVSISTIEQPYYSGLDFETTVVDNEDDDFSYGHIHAKFIKTSTGQWKSEYRELSPPKEEVSYILINLVRCTGCDRYSYPVST